MRSRFLGRNRCSALVRAFLALVVACSPLSGVCVAQTNSGPLVGRVLDGKGKELEGVLIVVINEAGGTSGRV